MDKKKIAIGIVALVVIIIAAVAIIGFTSNPDQEIKYDKYFSIDVPGDFKLVKSDGAVEYCSPSNESYTISLNKINDYTPKSMDSIFKGIKDDKKALGVRNISSYKIADVKAYDVMLAMSNENKQVLKNVGSDAKYSRFVYFVFPKSEDVYGLYILTNDSSVDLYSEEINEIVETVGY